MDYRRDDHYGATYVPGESILAAFPHVLLLMFSLSDNIRLLICLYTLIHDAISTSQMQGDFQPPWPSPASPRSALRIP